MMVDLLAVIQYQGQYSFDLNIEDDRPPHCEGRKVYGVVYHQTIATSSSVLRHAELFMMKIMAAVDAK